MEFRVERDMPTFQSLPREVDSLLSSRRTMLPEFAQSLYERFDREGIPLLLAGGWAVCHHGYTRYTKDVDWICSRANETKAKSLMASLGFSEAFDAMATRFQLTHNPGFIPFDLLWVDSQTFVKMAATDQRTGLHGDIPVIGLESLLAMKLYAVKDNETRHGKDLLDIRELLALNSHVFSEQKLRELCEKFAGPHGYDLVRRIS